jgi:hypothetical protein
VVVRSKHNLLGKWSDWPQWLLIAVALLTAGASFSSAIMDLESPTSLDASDSTGNSVIRTQSGDTTLESRLDIDYPTSIAVNSEDYVRLRLAVTSTPPTGQTHEVEFKAVSSGLSMMPTRGSRHTVSTLAGEDFIVSSTSPGTKVFNVSVAAVGDEAPHLTHVLQGQIVVYEQVDWWGRARDLANIVGFPSIVILVVTILLQKWRGQRDATGRA